MEQHQALAILSALGHETRLSVFRLLVTVGHDGLPAGEIAARVGVRPNTLSNHLGILSTAGLIRPQREGRVVRYCADFSMMQQFMRFMIQDCCNGRTELCSPLLAVLTDCEACVETGRSAEETLAAG